MALSKNANVMKALIEEVLRRHGKRGDEGRTKEDVEMALEMMSIMLRHQRVWCIADDIRFARDFRQATRIPVTHLPTPEHACGVEGGHVIVLHTGSRSPATQERFDAMMDFFKLREKIVFWHVGVWR